MKLLLSKAGKMQDLIHPSSLLLDFEQFSDSE